LTDVLAASSTRGLRWPKRLPERPDPTRCTAPFVAAHRCASRRRAVPGHRRRMSTRS